MEKKRGVLRSFPPVFWLVIVFEFFERGSYYGMMSVLSVYLTDVLGFAKENVGLIKGTIQPLLYFMPIVAGALGDRFGYRRTLLVAFSLLGTGYFLTANVTSYAAVFLALSVMGLGAGAFKPIISSTIARVTDEDNSTIGFGIFYWTINLGAFLFPLILVPYLKNNIGWNWVILASAIGTAAMILPTLFLFKEPPRKDEAEAKPKTDLFQTLANAFEIIYSPIVLVFKACRSNATTRGVTILGLAVLVATAAWMYAAPRSLVVVTPGTSMVVDGFPLEVRVQRNLTLPNGYRVTTTEGAGGTPVATVYDPDGLDSFLPGLARSLHEVGLPASVDEDAVADLIRSAERGIHLRLHETGSAEFAVVPWSEGIEIQVADPGRYTEYREALLTEVRAVPELATLSAGVVDDLFSRGSSRPFLLAFVALLVISAGILLALEPRYKAADRGRRSSIVLATVVVAGVLLWVVPGLSLFARIVSSVIYTTVLSILLIDFEDTSRFRDHFKFLLLIFIYSGFWVLYFQMFDSVLWYVQAYVDAESLNQAVNGALGAVGLGFNWRFDVEHVTVINAGTIILLQLLISVVVRKTRALPTMITGIAMGTLGMAILAISTDIWVFMVGIIVFSVGEMTAHPKFISYVGQIAPSDRVATYMGYIFLYGVIGSSIGGVLGAKLYVRFVDQLNQPRSLWLIFSLIGVVTIVALVFYDRFISGERSETA